MDTLTNINHNLFLFLNRSCAPFVDKLMHLITYTGDGIVLTVILLSMLAIFDRKRMFRIFLAVLFAAALGGLLVQFLKWEIGALRPLSIFPNAHIVGKPLKIGSFPSGHTQLCFSSAVILSKEYKKSWRFLYPWAFMVGLSRIYIGAHFPIDVMIGGLIGYLSGKALLCYNWLTHKEFFPLEEYKKKGEKECGKG